MLPAWYLIASRGLLGDSFEASWESFWSLLGRLLCPRGLLGASWGLLGASWGLLEASWGGRLGFSVRVPPLGPLFGPSWGPLGPSWGALEALLGRLGALLGAFWAVLERRDDEKARTLKSFKDPREINDFDLLRRFWEKSWGFLGPSWRPLGPS